jgi:hypothetical protein
MPSLATLPWLLVLASLLFGAGGTLWYRAEYESCVAARASDQAAAETAKAAALQKAQQDSDAIIVQQAEALAQRAQQASTAVTRIVNAPSTSGCGPVMRDASHSVRDLFDAARRGDAQAVGGAAAAVPGPGPGGKP